MNIAGRVRDAEGIGVPNVEVALEMFLGTWRPAGPTTTTNGAGNFGLAYPDGMAPSYRLAFSSGGSRLGESNAWVDGQSPGFVFFTLPPSVVVPGMVVDLLNAPVAGATVRLEVRDPATGNWMPASGINDALTGPSGDFVISYPAGIAQLYRLSFALSASLGNSTPWADDSPPANVLFQAPIGESVVSGTVVDWNGAAVGAITVTLQTLDPGTGVWQAAAGVAAETTDEAGAFSLTYPAGLAGDYRLAFSDNTGPLGESSSWPDGSPPSSVQFQLAQPGGGMPHTIIGVVTNVADGLPVSNVVTRLEYASGDGWLVYATAPPTAGDGKYTLTFEPSSIGSKFLRLTFVTDEGILLTPVGSTHQLAFFTTDPPSDVPAALRFPVVRGRVTHAEDGAPAVGLTPRLLTSRDGETWVEQAAGAPSSITGDYSVPFDRTSIELPFVRLAFDEDGEHATVLTEPPPQWPIAAVPAVYDASVVVAATAGTKPTPEPTFVTTPSPLHGRVIDASGAPRQGVPVRLTVEGALGPKHLASAVTDPAGAFSIAIEVDLLPSSTLRLQFGPASSPYDVLEGPASWRHADPPSTFAFRVRVPAAADPAAPGSVVTAFGTVRMPDGRPLPHRELDAGAANLRPPIRLRALSRRAGVADTQLAGPALPGTRGEYSLSMSVPAGGLSLQVVVEIDPLDDGNWEEVARSAVLRGSSSSALVDLVVTDPRVRGWSESDQCADVVQSAIQAASLDLATAGPLDDEVIAAEVGLPRLVVTHCRRAMRLKQEVEQGGGPVIALQVYHALTALGFPGRAAGFAHATADGGEDERAIRSAVEQRLLRPSWLEPQNLTPLLQDLESLVDIWRTIDRTYLLDLDQHRNLTPIELDVANPPLADEVTQRLLDRARKRLAKQVQPGSQALRDAVTRMEIRKGDALIATSVQELLVRSLRAGGAGLAVIAEAESAERSTSTEGQTNSADLDRPLVVNPAFQRDLAVAEFMRVGDTVGVSPTVVDAAAGAGLLVDNVSVATLDDAVTDSVITQAEAGAVADGVSLYRILDRRRDLLTSVKANFVSVTSPRHLVDLLESDWVTILTTGAVTPPGQMSAAQYASGLFRKVQDLFPTRAVRSAQTIPSQTQITQWLDELALLGPGQHVSTPVFDSIETSLTGPPLDAARAAHAALRLLHKQHPGLGLVQLLDDLAQSTGQRAAATVSRVQDFATFLDDNPDVVSADLSPGSAVLGSLVHTVADPEVRKRLEAGARGYQRARAFAGDVVDALAAVDAGYSSSLAVLNAGLDKYATDVGLSVEAAHKHLERARKIVAETATNVGALLDLSKGGFDQMAVGNVSAADALGFLKELPGFADFFGSLDYCQCEHCRSILSPAAYFVDLMCFVDKHVSQVYFAAPNQTHELNLRTRRPDLWSLELTCDNTNELVPYLEIINEILETYIANLTGYAGNLEDRAAVAQHVYRDTVRSAAHSFRQPLNLAFEEIRVYLEHFEPDLRRVAKVTGQSGPDLARVSLGISPEAWPLIVAANLELTFLTQIYGIPFTLNLGEVESFDAQLLLKRTDLDRHELQTLIASRFVTASGAVTISITGQKSSPESVQNDIEIISGLTPAALDRMHRMVRLWRATPWTLEELDLVILQLVGAGLSTGIDGALLELIAELLDLQDASGGSVEEVLALVATIPTEPVSGDAEALFDRLFDLAALSDGQAPWPTATVFLHPALAIVPTSPVDPALHRLQAGTRTSEDELYQLISGLAGPLGVVLDDPVEANRSFALSLGHLTLLYRHARVARALDLTIPELFELVALAPAISGTHLATFTDAVEIFRFSAWLGATRWSVDDLDVIVRRAPTVPSAYPDTAAVAQELVDQIADEGSQRFAGTVFAFLEGVTEEQSREICKQSTGAIEPVPDTDEFRLTATYDPAAPLVAPAEVTATDAELHEVLAAHDAPSLVRSILPGLLGTTPEKFDSLLDVLAVDLAQPAYRTDLRDATTTSLAPLAADVLPLVLLLGDAVFEVEQIGFVRDEASTMFGIGDFRALQVDGVARVEELRQQLTRLSDADPMPDLHGVLRAFAPAGNFASADTDVVADVFGCDVALASSLQSLDLSTNPIDAMVKLQELVIVAQHLGLGGGALTLLTSQGYDDLASGSASLYAAFRAKYEDEDEWGVRIEPYRDRLLSRRRDGLVAWLLYSGAPEFDEEHDLYNYFLLDVQLEGCARTSRVVAAISSVQLYVQRVRMNLEESPNGVPVPIHVSPESIPADEWSWRKSYRVWEANRKVFLWPENFIEPSLRDNKTPLFEELEKDLLGQTIDEDSVREAYAKYMRGFEEVARLTIAGSYHERDDESEYDVLHLFGVNEKDPPAFYYRRVERAHFGQLTDPPSTSFGPWEPISAQIAARTVSPIVYRGRLYVFWVERTTRPVDDLDDGATVFSGYHHYFEVKYILRKLDGSWTSAQTLDLGEEAPFHTAGRGVVFDERYYFPSPAGVQNRVYYDEERNLHKTARKGYTVEGWNWTTVYPHLFSYDLALRGVNYDMWSEVDFYNATIGDRIHHRVVWEPPYLDRYSAGMYHVYTGWGFTAPRALTSELVSPSSNHRYLYENAVPLQNTLIDGYSFATVVLCKERFDYFNSPLPHVADKVGFTNQWPDELTDAVESDGLSNRTRIGTFYDDKALSLGVVNGSLGDVVAGVSGQAFWFQEGVRGDGKYRLSRLSTGLVGTLAETLFNQGVDSMLSTGFQLQLAEPQGAFNMLAEKVFDDTKVGSVDYVGAMGVYLREVFFHIPFLIANHLNSQADFEGAQRWYHTIFDPTANELITGLDPGLTDAERSARELDRNWRYREFRGLTPESLRARLTQTSAITAYKEDPFNPHAIARLRLSAYQKAIVMKYVDNLLDWGDHLFAQDTMESINEATLLYVMAAELLGDRPVELGDCSEWTEPFTFASIDCCTFEDSEFLLEVEVLPQRQEASAAHEPVGPAGGELVTLRAAKSAGRRSYARAGGKMLAPPASAHQGVGGLAQAIAQDGALPLDHLDWLDADDQLPAIVPPNSTIDDAFADPAAGEGWEAGFAAPLLTQLIFCVPHNAELIGYWDRVEDRLFKIRNCMNLSGVRRQLALFAPPIDPRLLVRARAAGLSLDDVLASTAGELPPYRFQFLIRKAREYASTLRSFGAALLAALEKRDAEELAQLRNTHQRNILELTTEARNFAIATANQALAIIDARIADAEFRSEHFQGLIDGGLNGSETVQSVSTFVSTILNGIDGTIKLAAAIAYLFPNAGSPFAMTYGGREIGSSAEAWGNMVRATAQVADAVARTAGLQANFKRRAQGWQFQLDLADKKLETLSAERLAAEIRVDAAKHALTIHEKSVEQADELIAFYGEKFTGLGLYTFLSSELQRLYRDAYSVALAFARLAEAAYRFERDDSSFLLAGNYWDASRAGLMAGARLSLDLDRMEQRYLETHHRTPEINQSFSVLQIDPAALIELKQTGSCSFSIPEVYFDLVYPGHYKRRIKAVRVTIPCITGPYTNIGAKLSLQSSQVRRTPDIEASLEDVPLTRSVSVATSTAQGDGGVFDLNFRDERYMPFEGMGAISTWKLELPSAFRSFDYHSINDVILNLSYTALDDGLLREKVEALQNEAAASILGTLKASPVMRAFSLRQEFSRVFHQLLHSPLNTAVPLELTERHFPAFIQGQTLQVSGSKLVLVPAVGQTTAGVDIMVGSESVTGFTPDPGFGELPTSVVLASAFGAGLKGTHDLTIVSGGDLAPAGAPPTPVLDVDKIEDIVLYVEFHISAGS